VLNREFDFIAYRNEFVEKFRGLGRSIAFTLFGVAVGSAFEGLDAALSPDTITWDSNGD
jgi:hypothetical protein